MLLFFYIYLCRYVLFRFIPPRELYACAQRLNFARILVESAINFQKC